MRILVAEEDDNLQEDLPESLKLDGFGGDLVGTCETGDAAVPVFRHVVIVLDTGLPDGADSIFSNSGAGVASRRLSCHS